MEENLNLKKNKRDKNGVQCLDLHFEKKKKRKRTHYMTSSLLLVSHELYNYSIGYVCFDQLDAKNNLCRFWSVRL